MTNELLDIIEYTARVARQAWEPFWPIWKRSGDHPDPDGDPVSHDTCIPTAFSLASILNRMVPEFRWRAVGGRPTKRTPMGGYQGLDGVPRPHFWTLGSRRDEAVVVDITADQFGGPVVIAVTDQSRHVSNASRPLIRQYALIEAGTVEMMVALFDVAMREQSSDNRRVEDGDSQYLAAVSREVIPVRGENAAQHRRGRFLAG